MPFDHRDLQLIIKISEQKSLTQGAKAIHMSLATASIRIKKLEERLGIQMLYRNSTGVEFTPAGNVLLRHAWKTVSQLEALKAELGTYHNGLRTHLRVFANTTAVTEFMPRILSLYLVQYPNVSVTLEEHLTDQILHSVADGAADLGIVAGVDRVQGLEIMRFSTDRLIVAAAPEHPIARHSAITFLETLNYAQIGLYNSSTLQMFLQRILAEEVKKLQLRVQVRGFEAMCDMIAHNVGIGILPLSVAKRYQKMFNLACVTLSDPWAVRERSLVVRHLDSMTTPARALAAMIMQKSPV